MKRRIGLGAVLGLTLAATLGCSDTTEERSGTAVPHGLIPRPLDVRLVQARGFSGDQPSGTAFRFDASTRVVLDADNARSRATVLRFLEAVQAEAGIPTSAAMAPGDSDGSVVRIVLDPQLSELHEEGYRLTLSRETVELRARASAGVQYGLETLRQLILAGKAAADATALALLPRGTIEDAPRFPYRGMHLDVGRHFFGPDEIKIYLDLLARYKFNRFHWHLTEDQGWRLEIKRYPKLTTIASSRSETILEKNFDPYVGDGTPHQGIYTQDQVRDIVAYAAERHITVIPEIELPGHSQAALAAYPELACTEGPFEVSTTWGVHEEIYCPKEETFAFLENVLTEVTDLFPSELIHIGGDEAPKARWQASQLAQSVMEREGLKDEDELQSYFIRRIEAFLRSKGRKLIGWDEILEGGLAPEATVMSWRGMEGGIAAARQGHDVVMTPTSHCYFDYYQGPPESEPLAIGGDLPLAKVYGFEPVPPELTAEEAKHILGAQGNVWTEYIKTWDHVEYMVLPRMLALAEVVWSTAESRDFERFLDSAEAHQRTLIALGHRVRPLNEPQEIK